MTQPIPETMKAAAIDRFGGPEELHVEPLPVPQPAADELLIELDTAGIGVWDPYIREGEFRLTPPHFPSSHRQRRRGDSRYRGFVGSSVQAWRSRLRVHDEGWILRGVRNGQGG